MNVTMTAPLLALARALNALLAEEARYKRLGVPELEMASRNAYNSIAAAIDAGKHTTGVHELCKG